MAPTRRNKSFRTQAQDKAFSEQSVLELAESCLGHSFLVFLIADLRLMSATGRVTTPYQAVVLDSDRCDKLTASDYACLNGDEEDSAPARGFTPAHIMALVMLAIQDELDASQGKTGLDGKASSTIPELNESIRNREEKEAKAAVHAMLKSYVAQYYADYQLGPVNVGIRPEWNDALQNLSPIMEEEDVAAEEEEGDQGEIEGLFTRPHLRQSIAVMKLRRSMLNLEIADSALFGSLKTKDCTAASAVAANAPAENCYTIDELVQLLRYATANHRPDIVQEIVPKAFEPDTVSYHMAQSTAEVVWINDWHPTKECTYAIAVNRKEQSVMVVFRGAITKADWGHAFESNHVPVVNPIEDEYDEKLSHIQLHSGFYRYLFRKRKDAGSTKYDEIANKLAHYCKQAGPDYRVVVCGHSLGAALSTVFSFFASTDERFTRNGALHVVTFGGPWVGGYQFSDAFRHQEDVGKIRLARFYNARDGVTCGPPTLFRMSKRGASVFHVGVGIELPMLRTRLYRPICCGQPRPRVKYQGRQSFWSSYFLQLRSFYLFNLPLRVWKLALFHTLEEHQRRLLLVDPERSPLVNCTMEELYEQRDTLRKTTK